MTFGEKIQKLRKEAGISQEELSFQLQVSRQAISKWENDKGYPETEKIIKMSKIFHVTLDYLLSDSENRNGNETEKGLYVSQEMASGFLLHETLKYRKMAFAIALLLAGAAFIFIINETAGILLYLIVMIVSIALFVSILLTGNPYRQIKQEALLFDDVFKKELLSNYMEKRKKYHVLIVGSIVLFCISFLVLPVVGLELVSDGGEEMMLAISMIMGGVAVYFFIYLLGTLRSYRLLAKNEEIQKGKK
ncbi:helix-turn-helix domain-containing protein [Lederbergia sp. NSJ-179]|uniref:helix-turn-helix domain-containing protein n=1 Tax=Lederbergia sp. NSJ-179 TaxID=2931402 RepID=UPI001FD57E96|nr:helix-turn-helix transcriptional regulator [Lederbergia sp. NSJ-179]MCJ7842781.1 helix-turn-helix domain-containing protein [Lederbergia sp. NSJ-179]